MVTAELALGSLFVAAFVMFIAWIVSVLMLYAGCQSTAGEVARQAARGDEAAVALAKKDAPGGSSVKIARDGEQVVVTVVLKAKPWGPLMPSVRLEASATTISESG
jgi:hypothetical protein